MSDWKIYIKKMESIYVMQQMTTLDLIYFEKYLFVIVKINLLNFIIIDELIKIGGPMY